MEKLTEFHKTFQSLDVKLQVVEIAVNEGTTKSFVNSVLTELVQNSIDAIRSLDKVEHTEEVINILKTQKSEIYSYMYRNKIEIYMFNNVIEVKDDVGISNIIPLLIPFLSSKNVDDPNVTGEMGTGFFNVFRQPYVKTVIITTVYNSIETIIECTPILGRNFDVTDIDYKINRKTTEEKNYTSILILLNNVEIIEMISDAIVYVSNYMSIIPNLYLNGKSFYRNKISIFEGDFGEVFYIPTGKDISSFVMTNDIPFLSLSEFISQFDGVYRYLAELCSNGIVINFNKSVYTPSQSRTKINISEEKIEPVSKFINDCLFFSVLMLYLDKYYRDEVIIHTSSKASIFELKITERKFTNYPNITNAYKSPIKELITSYIFQYNNEETNISSIINTRINTMNVSNFEETLIGRVVERWFSNKDKTNPEIIKKEANNLEKWYNMQLFVDIYLYHVKHLINNKVIQGSKITKKNVTVLYGKLEDNLLGSYNNKTNNLSINSDNFDKQLFELRLSELLKIRNNTEIISKINEDPELIKYFSTNINTTLIHELGHVIQGKNHTSSFHGLTNISINGGENLMFDEMCTQIYILCLQEGLMSDYIEDLKELM